MPKGDKEILKADPENGTTPIAHLLLEALAIAKLTGKEKGAILYLWRVTYGWLVDGERLKEREIALATWSKVLQTDEGKASKILSGLTDKHILLRESLGPGKSYSYSMNTRVAEWDKGCLNRQALFLLLAQKPPKRGHFKAKRVVENDKGCPVGEGLSKTTRQGLSKTTTPPDTNLATPKESIKSILKKDIYIVLFNLWNELRIITHKKLTGDMKQAIDSARKDYSQEEMAQAMRNYAVIVKGTEYYFDHRWTLAEFLSRRKGNNIERFLDLEIAKSNFRKEARHGTNRQDTRKFPKAGEYETPEEHFGRDNA